MKALFNKITLNITVILVLSLVVISCDVMNSDNELIYHSYSSLGVSADTVKAGSSVDLQIYIWNYGNELFNLKEDVRDDEISFQVLLRGEEPDYDSIWCPVGTGNIILERSYELSKPDMFTFSALQPDGQAMEQVVVVK